MNYGTLVKDAWTTTWHHRFLWVLGLFAGSSAGPWLLGQNGNRLQYNVDRRELSGLDPEVSRALTSVAVYLGDHLTLVLAAVAALIVIGLGLVVLSVIGQGGMAKATAEIDQGREVSAGFAWRAGLRLFWRYLGLGLLIFGAVIALALAIAIVFGAGVALAVVGGQAIRISLIVVGVLVGISLILAAIPVGIAASIVVAYAQRAIAVEEIGPIQGLFSGWRVFRANLGTSLVIWLINLGLSIAAGIGFFLALTVVAGILVVIGGIVWAVVGGFSGAVIAYVVLAVLVAIAVLWWLSAVINTYFWSYWTTAYLRLTGKLAEAEG